MFNVLINYKNKSTNQIINTFTLKSQIIVC